MPTLAQQLSTKEFVNRVFSDRQLGEVPGANVARRYGVSTGALRDGSLVRLPDLRIRAVSGLCGKPELMVQFWTADFFRKDNIPSYRW